ncbi:MAG: hypothetical protein M3496_12995 [Pseudomonadota bacterium]|nr:hypothetical protein [Pseudomonadota bacterium]
MAHVDEDSLWRKQGCTQARMQRVRGGLGQSFGAIDLRQDAAHFADHAAKRYRGLACREFVDKQRELSGDPLAVVLAHDVVTPTLAKRGYRRGL